jgi:hypothetical protein
MGGRHDYRLGRGQAYEEEGVQMRCKELSNSIRWPSKQKLGFGALLRFQLPIHIHPNKKSEIVVYFSFLGDLVLWSNSIPKSSIHTSKQSPRCILTSGPYWFSSKELFQKGSNGVGKEKKLYAKKWYKKELM